MASGNKTLGILLASVAATTAMTAFSHFFSKAKKDNYNEPVLLGDFLEKAVIKEKRSALVSAWTVHYAVGFLFGLIYEPTFKKIKTRSATKKGLCFGLSAGSIAIVAWSMVFKMHPDKPKINFRVYYQQLMAAHLIFGLVFAKASDPQNEVHD
ncbi:hypothetical protein [Dyadobacter sp. CY323]|uniref:hypothetical protein n=1 Tax=Dyadobacter sp. CY323 TaxID=2907302 RepID=UPI001F4839E0|nr:hypothetical protein [Dyadobacter sp. CY323]MCE6988064.1 hypothetical protein [Dyadobacter sp. CY323]